MVLGPRGERLSEASRQDGRAATAQLLSLLPAVKIGVGGELKNVESIISKLGAPRPLSSAAEVHQKMGVRKNTVRLPLSSQIKISIEIDVFHQRRALKKNL